MDSNHNTFLFFDDGSEHEFGREIDFRAEFESKLRANNENIPMILIVVQGGDGTLKTILHSIESKIPILILEVNIMSY